MTEPEDKPRPTLAARGEFETGESGLGLGLGMAWERLVDRERPFDHAPGDLPPPDVDLTALAARPLIAPAGEMEPNSFTDFSARSRNLARKMAAEDPATTELEFLHAQLVMALRRSDVPAQALTLYFRIWDEHGARLAREMPTRWRVSAAQCFADHGRTEAERSLGAQMALMFGLVKLYESERRFSGLAAWELFANRRPHKGPLMMGLAAYDLREGDLPRNLLARIWRQSLDAGPMGQLAEALISDFETSNRGLLIRLHKMGKRVAPRAD
ncbi:hypothetical protein C8J30_12611 [Rhodobacter viridis]|uniref:Uncharacterized protein n=1 Tax=Rhodobacter viridis TaxID=1054202 RepID=A0A318TP45_9RHOB|nr:hypothetical protein [Rhodobacter viridis]PYF06556.1 hypothetical protein C8J30_12611 [Rhodobacter viridis]